MQKWRAEVETTTDAHDHPWIKHGVDQTAPAGMPPQPQYGELDQSNIQGKSRNREERV